MTDDMVGREALERKGDWFFLAEEVRGLLTLSPKFAALCRRMLAGGSGGFREFELALRGALLAGAAAGASAVLSALDGELEAPSCGRCGSARRRRGTRSMSPLSLLGRLSLRRGYWTCRCPKGGAHLLDRALGIAGRAGVRLTPAALWALAEEAAEKSFAKAAERLRRLAGVSVTARQAGREIAAWEESAPALDEAPAETMCCSPDGTGVPMVRRDAGAGRTACRRRRGRRRWWCSTPRSGAETGLPERDAGSARHSAAIDSAGSKDADPEPSPFARFPRPQRMPGFPVTLNPPNKYVVHPPRPPRTNFLTCLPKGVWWRHLLGETGSWNTPF